MNKPVLYSTELVCALFRHASVRGLIDDIRLALNQDLPLRNKRFHARIEHLTRLAEAGGVVEYPGQGRWNKCEPCPFPYEKPVPPVPGPSS